MREGELRVVRSHKDTVFRMLYEDRRNLLELYNALNGTAYEEEGLLEICTLEKYAAGKTLYTSKQIRIPVPRFVVFYNGTQDQPERRILKLSDAFDKEVSTPELELKVLMLNINPGKNRELLEKCKTLREYCQFIECIRKNASGMEIGEAVDRAVTECIREGILSEFLAAQRAEVVAMSIFEYNEEEEMKKIRAAEYSVGEEAGMEKGKLKGKAEFVLELLEYLGEVPDELRRRILSESDLSVLKRYLRAAARAESIRAFEEQSGIARHMKTSLAV